VRPGRVRGRKGRVGKSQFGKKGVEHRPMWVRKKGELEKRESSWSIVEPGGEGESA